MVSFLLSFDCGHHTLWVFIRFGVIGGMVCHAYGTVVVGNALLEFVSVCFVCLVIVFA